MHQVKHTQVAVASVKALPQFFVSGVKPIDGEVYARIKQAADVMVCAIALVVLMPLLLTVAALICLESRGGALYRQRRVGANGSIFEIYKFRTMHQGTEWLGFKTEDNDPRVTRLGAILRRLKIDELPQLYNVVLGDMSIIGPRPLSVEESEYIAKSGYANYPGFPPTVKPGLIGLEQVSRCGRTLSYRERFFLNHQYEQQFGLGMDAYVFFTALKKCRHVCGLMVATGLAELFLLANFLSF